MIDAWMHGLLMQTLALSVAALAVRCLQAAFARLFGVAACYLCWLLVPVAMGAVALPHLGVVPLTIRVDLATLEPGWVASSTIALPGSSGHLGALTMAAWVVGAVALAVGLMQRQRSFEALVTSAAAGSMPCLPAGVGPAVLGVWKRRVVLPLDFDLAFDGEERRLMLLHEGVHLGRGDNLWNLLAAVLLVLHWFNPIAWWAWRRMRADQELSCDAAVLRHEESGALAVYAGALLKAQGVTLTPPLATAWQSSHPLVERVRMLHRHRISSARHRAGLRVAALSILLAGMSGYALQAGASASPAPETVNGDSVMTVIKVAVDTKPDVGGRHNRSTLESRMLTRVGQQAVLRYGSDGVQKVLPVPFEIAYTVTRLPGDRLQIDATVRQGTPLATLASPRLITHEGEVARAEMKGSDGEQDVAVSFVPSYFRAKATLPGDDANARKTSGSDALAPPQRAL